MKGKKKLPSIDIQGSSEATFELRDGKIVRVEKHKPKAGSPQDAGP